MKKKLVILLSFVMLATTLFPITASAASNASTFDKIKAKDIKKYDVKLPTKGTKKTLKQIQKLEKKIKYKIPGKGSTKYNASLSFFRAKGAKKGKYTSAEKSKTWTTENTKAKTSSYYEETLELASAYKGENFGKTRMWLVDSTKNESTYYDWFKGEKTGTYFISKHDNTPSKDNYKPEKPKNIKLYKDQKVLGQKCMVYSYTLGKGKNKSTYYSYISRKTGDLAKRVIVSSQGTSTSLNFVIKKQNKATSFYSAPKDVKFEKAY